MSEEVSEYIENPPQSVICNKHDVLLARTGATGEVVTNVEGVFHNNFFKINYNKDKILKDYLVYYLKFDGIKKILLLKAGVTTIPDLNHDSFLGTSVVIPSKEKQQIVNFLDQKTSQIDCLIQKIESAVIKLHEYRSSVITAVVTGKIDLRRHEYATG